MSAHGSHLGWGSWSPDTILKVYCPRTIHAMFALNWLIGFRGENSNWKTQTDSEEISLIYRFLS
jgi:hypothetical protein